LWGSRVELCLSPLFSFIFSDSSFEIISHSVWPLTLFLLRRLPLPYDPPRVPRACLLGASLTPPRTASGPTVPIRFKQSRTRAAMRWRGGLGSSLPRDCSLTSCNCSPCSRRVGFHFVPLFLLCYLSLCSWRFDFHSLPSSLVVGRLRGCGCCRCWVSPVGLCLPFFLFYATLQEFSVLFFQGRA